MNIPSGRCSLRAAVQQANATAGEDRIRFSPDLSAPVVFLLTRVGEDDSANSGDLDISGNLVIEGEGMGSTIVDGNRGVTNDGVFHILGGAVVSLSGMTVQNGYHPSFGGGIDNQGDLTLAASLITANLAGNGGGIANRGTLRMTGCHVTDNIANNRGGGIFGEGGVVTLAEGTVVSGNSAIYGGGIFGASSGSVSLSNSMVSTNTAAANGGGVYNQATVTLTLSESTVSANHAGNPTKNEGIGGGIYNQGTVVLSHNMVSANASYDKGGGIYNDFNATMSLTHGSTVIGNLADRYGGGIHNSGTAVVTDSTVMGNTAIVFDGGGIYNYGGPMTLSNSTISGNKAGEKGGGMFNVNTLTLSNSTVSGNAAKTDGGGVFNNNVLDLMNTTIAGNIADSDNNGTESGGGIYTIVDCPVNVRNSVVADNLHLEPGGRFPLAVNDDCAGTLNSEGYNLIKDLSGCTLMNMMADKSAMSPLLGPLADNGGPTWTHALLPGSPALDAGNPAGCKDGMNADLATDQRGAARPTGKRCDMGAYELGPLTPAPSPSPSETSAVEPTTNPMPTGTATAPATMITPTATVKRTATATTVATVTETGTDTLPVATGATPPVDRHPVFLPVALCRIALPR